MTNHLVVGGVEKNIVRLTRELTARGHDVTVAAGDGSLVAELQAAGGRFVPLAMRRDARSLRADVTTLSDTLATVDPDIVHVFSASAAVVTNAARARNRLRRRGPGTAVVASVMGLHNHPDEASFRVAARVLATAVGARRLLVIAPAIGAVVRRLPIPRGRIVEVPVVGVELPDIVGERGDAGIRKELGLPPDTPLVTTIGRLDPRKSHELFIRAAVGVRRAHPDVHFLVVGDGVLEDELRAEARACGVAEAMHFLGSRHDVDDLLDATDVCVRPGVVEGFVGITVLEAQAHEVPVVSFETEDVKLAITDGATGLLVPPGDVDALAAAVIGLLSDRPAARRLAEAGRRSVEAKFSMAAVVEGLEQVYRDVSSSTDPGV